MNDFIFIIPVLICLLFEQFFSVSESSFIAINHIRVRHLAQKGNKKCKKLLRFLKEPAQFLSTTLIGSNLCVIISTTILTSVIVDKLGKLGGFIAPFMISPFLLLFGEIIPKTYSYRNSQRAAEFIVTPISFFSHIFSPLIYFLIKVTNMVMKSLGSEERVHSLKLTREDLIMLIKMDRTGAILEEEEKKMINKIFGFGETVVREVMVPLINVVSVEKNTMISDFMEKAKKSNFSRYPVFDERVDNICGVINVFDLFYAEEGEETINRFIRPAYYVPETKYADVLLREFQSQGMQMAVVVDEYGGNLGIVTLEDILEEVVGEIHDEYDKEEEKVARLKDGSYIFDAGMEIDYINEIFKLNIPKGDYETLGGLLISEFEKIPLEGEKVTIGVNTFTIIKADVRKIKQVMVKNKTSLHNSKQN